MAEVNEDIVRTYFESKGFFTISNVKFMKEAKETGKKSSGRGDIDILGFNPKTDEGIAVEIKGWHTEKFTRGYENRKPIISYFSSIGLIKKTAKKFLGDHKLKLILVVPRPSNDFKNIAKERGVDEIIGFKEILSELLDNIKIEFPYTNETEQMLRLLKIYGFIK